MSILNFESPGTSIQIQSRTEGNVRRFPDHSKFSYYLEGLPQELFVHVVSLLSLPDIGNLSLTGSAGIKAKIIDWIMSR